MSALVINGEVVCCGLQFIDRSLRLNIVVTKILVGMAGVNMSFFTLLLQRRIRHHGLFSRVILTQILRRGLRVILRVLLLGVAVQLGGRLVAGCVGVGQ